MNVNQKGKEQHTYDAIVVGSGISGGWAAKELCEKGLKVLMLERGKPLEHPNYPTAAKEPWEFTNAMRLTQEDRERGYVQQRHYSYRGDNKEFYINDMENPYTEKKRFDWIRGDIVGGRSVLWARMSYRWSDLDFTANARDGYGVDWPVRYNDIAPWYDYVESFIGVSGKAEGIPHLPDGKFLPPMEMNCVEKEFKSALEKKYPERRVTIGRSANLTQPVKGRGQCQARNLCHRGCPYGAYFSTNASTLPAAFATGNLTLRPHSLVNRVLYDEQKGKATGVEIVDTESNEVMEFYSRIIFLNAATVATAFILLNSISGRFPNGLGNGSDQVGRNLMDHHKQRAHRLPSMDSKICITLVGVQPDFISRVSEILMGMTRIICVDLDCREVPAARMEQSGEGYRLGSTLKEQAQIPGNWNIGFGGFGECLPYPENRVTLNKEQKDKWGRSTVTVDAEFKDNEKAMQQDMAASMGEMFEEIGYKNVRTYVNTSFPGNANHEMGTARMGKDPKTSVLNAYNQMHEVSNVFITDGSCMASSSCVNPSLTYMALTARACDYAVREMKMQNL